jgi:hypothetical protein
VTFTVMTAGDDESVTIDHADAVGVVVEEGHLVLRGNRGIIGIYAPGRWAYVVESRGEAGRGRRIALPPQTA